MQREKKDVSELISSIVAFKVEVGSLFSVSSL